MRPAKSASSVGTCRTWLTQAQRLTLPGQSGVGDETLKRFFAVGEVVVIKARWMIRDHQSGDRYVRYEDVDDFAGTARDQETGAVSESADGIRVVMVGDARCPGE